MSRVGKNPITIPSGVSVNVNNNVVEVNGPLGKLSREIHPKIDVVIEGNDVKVLNKTNDKELKKFHGLYRQLINNMVIGVSKGYEKQLTINGVGYKITQKGNDLVLNIGLSHPVDVIAEEGIKLSCDKNIITVKGIDKEKVGQFASRVRDIKPVEPYHAYGIYYTDEVVFRKERKTGKK